MKYSIYLSFALLTFFLAGCTTVSSDMQEEIIEGDKISGSAAYNWQLTDLSDSMNSTSLRVRPQPQRLEKNYRVEQFQRTWGDTTRYRYVAVPFVHDDYSAVQDVVEFFLLPWSIGAKVVLPFTVTDQQRFTACAAHAIGWLPFVNMPLAHAHFQWQDEPEVISGSARERSISPAERSATVTTDDLDDKRLRWHLSAVDARAEDFSGEAALSAILELPWAEIVTAEPQVERWRLAVSSRDIELSGVTEKTFEADLRDALRRRWPDDRQRPELSLAIDRISIVSLDGREQDVFYTGFEQRLTFRVRNTSRSDTAYFLEPSVTAPGTDFELEPGEGVDYLKPGERAEFEVVMTAPLLAEERDVELHFAVRDAFDRRSDASPHQVTVQRSDLPSLAVRSAVFREADQEGRYELEIEISNRGDGEARQVRVLLQAHGDDYELIQNERTIPNIDPHRRDMAVFEMRSATDDPDVVLPLRIQLTEELGVEPVIVDIEAARF